MTTASVFMTILTIVCYGRKSFFGQISIILVRYVMCINLHRMCCAASLLFFLKHKIFKNCKISQDWQEKDTLGVSGRKKNTQGAKDQKEITTEAPGHPNVQGIPIPRQLPQRIPEKKKHGTCA